MSVGIFKNGKYNKVAGNAKDSTAANTTYNNGTSGLQANNVQSAIDELDSTIDTLNSNLNYSSNSTVSVINMEGYNSRNNNCFRDGNIVTVSCEVYDMSVVATGVYFNIPEGYRPTKHIVNIMGYVEYMGSMQPSMFSIATNGNVNINHGGGLTSQIGFACTYHI